MFKTNSLIFKTRLIGFIAALFLLLATLLAITLTVYYDKKVEMDRAIMLYRTLFEEKPDEATFKMYLDMHHLTPISMDEAMEVMRKGTLLLADEGLADTFRDANIEIFIYKDQYYYAYKQDTMYYFRSEAPMTPVKTYILLVAGAVALLLVWLHRYVENSIKPLKRLHGEIRRFGRGETEITTRIDGDDEVAEVANAFDEAVQTILHLEKGRALFLRNLLHELKTPIQKGKLVVFMQPESPDKEMLEEVFVQMEQELNDLVRIEAFTTGKVALNLTPCAAIDLYEEAAEKLGLTPEQAVHDIRDQQVTVDFQLFSLALKNLLDNARKYATGLPVKVEWNDRRLLIVNEGPPLEGSFRDYLKPFTRDQTHHSLEGMGLGLYIANEILERHGFALEYRYREGRHHVSVVFSPC